MAEWSGFFDAHKLGDTWDRVYLAEHFASYFSPLIGKGVFAGQSNELQVLQDSPANMSVTVSSGRAWIEGYGYSNTSDLTLSVDPADGALGRLDRVVIQWSSQDRQIKAVWKKGTPAVSPVLPELRWDADYKELNLAILNISAGLSAITQAQIQDTRTNTAICGWVTGLINQVDTSTLFDQWESAYQQYFETQKDAWETFFESIQQDLGVPVPSADTKNQIMTVNSQGNGYTLTDTPIVSIPTQSTQAANKQYVDTAVAANKQYVDTAVHLGAISVRGVGSITTPSSYGTMTSLFLNRVIAQSGPNFRRFEGGIKVPSDGVIAVSSSVYGFSQNSEEMDCGVRVYKGDTEIAAAQVFGMTEGVIGTPMAIVPVSAGDLICVYVTSSVAMTVSVSHVNTHLDIMYV